MNKKITLMRREAEKAAHCPLRAGDYLILGRSVYFFDGSIATYIGEQHEGTQGVGWIDPP